jgi:hypothetical protein
MRACYKVKEEEFEEDNDEEEFKEKVGELSGKNHEGRRNESMIKRNRLSAKSGNESSQGADDED